MNSKLIIFIFSFPLLGMEKIPDGQRIFSFIHEQSTPNPIVNTNEQATFSCDAQGCTHLFWNQEALLAHRQTDHWIGNGLHKTPTHIPTYRPCVAQGCAYIAVSEAALSRHAQHFHSASMKRCSLSGCSFTAPNQDGLALHEERCRVRDANKKNSQIIHQKVGVFSYVQPKNISQASPKAPLPASPPPQQSIFTCSSEGCECTFKSASELFTHGNVKHWHDKRHNIMETQKSYNCPYRDCWYRCLHLCSLKKHTNTTHTQQQALFLVCSSPKCLYKTPDSSLLEAHEKICVYKNMQQVNTRPKKRSNTHILDNRPHKEQCITAENTPMPAYSSMTGIATADSTDSCAEIDSLPFTFSMPQIETIPIESMGMPADSSTTTIATSDSCSEIDPYSLSIDERSNWLDPHTFDDLSHP